MLICWLPSVLAVGIFCLWLVCSKVREKLKIPIENKFAIFFLFLFFAGFWSVNFFPETVWYLKFFVVLSSLVFFLINYKIPGFLFAGIGAFL
ncbi:hypothetical protein H5T58_01395, partial [Candidatus Parcubacteria bacterium]|nr:hypothetical protein [Candidatus Parcubacteria bacterium]